MPVMRRRWLQNAIKDEGRVREYLMRVYGPRAFDSKGRIKMTYLNKAINRVKYGPGRNYDGLLNALYLAKRLKQMHRR